jgi:DNA-directed RNA polymerase III subunit RPC7
VTDDLHPATRDIVLRHQQVQPPPQAPQATEDEVKSVKYYLAIRDRIHNGPFYTLLNDGMRNGLKRKAHDPAPTEAQLFNPFTDNETYTSKYHKVRRRLPKLDSRPYGKTGQEKLCSEIGR